MKGSHAFGGIITLIIILLIGMVIAPLVGWPKIGKMSYLKPGPTGKPGTATPGT